MINEFHNKNNMKGLKKLEANSIDCMITDPPYGYNFMNKGWDKILPPIATWKECLRVLKPGSFAFVMSAPRQDVLSRMIINLEDAGFKTGFTSIYWTYASGFPKAGNIGKLVDKKIGVKREIIGKYKSTIPQISPRKNFGKRYGDKDNYKQNITVPSSPEAKTLDGSYAGFQPKPAVEVIIVAMKPLNQPTYIDQALSNGKGVTWLDDCRVPYQSDDDNGRFPANLLVSDDVLNNGNITKSIGSLTNTTPSKANKQIYNYKNYDNMYTSGTHHNDSGSFSRYFDLDAWWNKNITDLPPEVQDTFPWLIVPKASSSEKNEGLDNLKEQETNYGSGGGAMPSGNNNNIKTKTKNIHPTVKPLKLMSYLITLGSRPNDIILDPYGGSGTTGIAAYRLKRQFILFESEPKYHEIAKARLLNETKTKDAFDKW